MRKDADGRRAPALALPDICPDGSGAPYHLVNAALNLQASREAELSDRMSDFYLFSRFYVGGPRTGYVRTSVMDVVLPELRLDTAIAVSGAAAAPAMGTYTNRGLGFLMTLLNVRMGYWMANPRYLREWFREGEGGVTLRQLRSAWRALRLRPGPTLLLNELTGQVDATGPLVNVSDGGHLENTGVYELLRRRCRYIVVIDAESDPNMAFGALASLVRYARLDLGIEIEVSLDALEPDEDGLCARHATVATIWYPKRPGEDRQETGKLLYLKSSLTGDEDEIINKYRADNPDFPHQTTADQFFDEVQFEAYRSLGFHMAQGLFVRDGERARRRLASFQQLEAWFERLPVKLTPSLVGDFDLPAVADLMSRIEDALHQPELECYLYEIYPQLGPCAPVAPDDRATTQAIFHAVGLQLQVMQLVFYQLSLDHAVNQAHPSALGWVNQFQLWASSRSFRRAYLLRVGTYGRRFFKFAEEVLDLRLELKWRPRSPDPTPDEVRLVASMCGDLDDQRLLVLWCDMGTDRPLPIGLAEDRRDSEIRLLASHDGPNVVDKAHQLLRLQLRQTLVT
jgi:hypothetical protein